MSVCRRGTQIGLVELVNERTDLVQPYETRATRAATREWAPFE